MAHRATAVHIIGVLAIEATLLKNDFMHFFRGGLKFNLLLKKEHTKATPKKTF